MFVWTQPCMTVCVLFVDMTRKCQLLCGCTSPGCRARFLGHAFYGSLLSLPLLSLSVSLSLSVCLSLSLSISPPPLSLPLSLPPLSPSLSPYLSPSLSPPLPPSTAELKALTLSHPLSSCLPCQGVLVVTNQFISVRYVTPTHPL